MINDRLNTDEIIRKNMSKDDNNIYWDSEKEAFVLRPKSDSLWQEMGYIDPNEIHCDGPHSPDYIDPDMLISLIIQYNRDIRQGFVNGFPMSYDEVSLREAIEKYNDVVEVKYRNGLRKKDDRKV